jgi:hypothetical protein
VESLLDSLSQGLSPSDALTAKNLPSRLIHSLITTLQAQVSLAVRASSDQVASWPKKSVRFDMEAQSVESSQADATASTEILPNFCARNDFCVHVRIFSQQLASSTNECIGYFQQSQHCRLLVYFAHPIMTNPPRRSVLLYKLVDSISHNLQTIQLLNYKRLQLACQLVTSVLRFHDTPIMKKSWRSEDVGFLSSETNSLIERQALETPYLEARVQGFERSIYPGSETEPDDVSLIRNSCLFSLGVVLIEIAYQVPLHELSQRMTIPNNLSQVYKEVLIANRLSKIIDNMLGSTYADVVQKYLSCNFGQGDDLNSATLQAMFYTDVVCELERLETQFCKIQTGR